MPPPTGLGLGVLLGGVIAVAGTDGLLTTWGTLLILFGIALTLIIPEIVSARPGALRSLIPRVAVRPQVRRLFFTALPALVSGMVAIALFLGVTPIPFSRCLSASKTPGSRDSPR